LLAVAFVAVGVAAASDAWLDIAHRAWGDEEASHVLLVPVVVLWLVWVRRRRLRHCAPSTSLVGTLLVAVGWGMYSWGDRLLLESVWHAGAVVIAVGCLLTVVGHQVLFELLPAFAVLIFLVPVPGTVRQTIAIPLQTVTAAAAQQIFEVLGVVVQRTGNTLMLNNKEIEIAEACNGLRMVFALALVSFAFGFGSPLRTHVRIAILLATPVSAVACNVVRLVPTVWMYGYHPGELANGFHEVSGWAMLLVSFGVLLGIIRLLRWAMLPVTRFTLAYD
jgi:exosortase